MKKYPREIHVPPHLSYSQKNTLTTCSWQWALERGLGVPQRPSWATVAGNAVHTATEWWDHWTLAGEWVTDRGRIETLFHDAFDQEIKKRLEQEPDYTTADWRASGRASKQWPEKENEAFWRSQGPGHVMSWVTWRTNNPQWEIVNIPDLIVGIEVEFTTELGGVPVRGYIDRVFHRAEVEIMVVDIKSGSRTPDSAGQLGTYAVALEEQYGITPAWGSYWMSRQGGTTEPVDMRMWPKARLDHDYRVAQEIRERGLFTPKESSMCSGCSVRDWCLAVNGKNSDLVPTPWEVTIVKPEPPSA